MPYDNRPFSGEMDVFIYNFDFHFSLSNELFISSAKKEIS